jgi:hypothetical protein
MTRYTLRRLVLALALLCALVTGVIVRAQRATTTMISAANAFVASLTPEQKKQATFAYDADERMHWNFIPDEAFPRNGLPLKEMTAAQKALALALLHSGLSDRGYQTYTSIMALENVLRAIEGGQRFKRDPEAHRVSIFGTPDAKGTWGWRVEGHHVSLHFTVSNGTAIASTPSFAGSNPAEVRDGAEKGKRVLAQQEDSGRSLVMALDEAQRKTAVINGMAPNEIVTNNNLTINPLSPDGLKGSAMTPAQRDLLLKVIDAYAGLMTADVAADRLAKIKTAGVENVAFAWAGPLERGQKHYYRVQGPTFLIEFDNTQNDGNHVHSIWRDFKGDFGRDLLREHLQASAH